MAGASITPLNLAYMIEISFVINLSYHELKTYKFRDEMKERADGLLEQYQDMWVGDDDDIFLANPEWGYLEKFHTGADKAAWDNKCRRFFYHHLIFNGNDRLIVKGLLVTDVIILFICTYFADHIVVNIGDGLDGFLWGLSYLFLAGSIIVPSALMWLIRVCRRYAFGSLEEDCGGSIGQPTSGRMYDLGQSVLKKVKKLSAIVLNSDNGNQSDN
ncbi:MAG: hypothetical protein A6F72_02600 [Cycloclasticus sp. symbiont of Poecilosclerida sp. N]|nr:MAG: hypothetical protein A6F72_02600 [Cycloclasticus sp. symbiont of Poecilosclerida sp. N]